MKQRRYKIWIIIFLITIIVILMYLLTKNVGYIYNGKTANSTGNVDIFDITIDNVTNTSIPISIRKSTPNLNII